ncbi:hypothetical protein D3C75_631790 [compost metagenome]
MQNADDISQLPGAYGIAQPLVPAVVHVHGYLGIEAACDGGQRQAARPGKQIRLQALVLQRSVQCGFRVQRDAEAARRIIARAGGNYRERDNPAPQCAKHAVDRAVAADQDGGSPVVTAGKRVKHLRLCLVCVIGEQGFVGNAARLQHTLDALPGPLPGTAAGTGVYNQ